MAHARRLSRYLVRFALLPCPPERSQELWDSLPSKTAADREGAPAIRSTPHYIHYIPFFRLFPAVLQRTVSASRIQMRGLAHNVKVRQSRACPEADARWDAARHMKLFQPCHGCIAIGLPMSLCPRILLRRDATSSRRPLEAEQGQVSHKPSAGTEDSAAPGLRGTQRHCSCPPCRCPGRYTVRDAV